MLGGAARLAACVACCVCGIACARPDTTVHLSAPHEIRWEVRDLEGEHLCWLPCDVELDEQEWVTVARHDGRTRFLLRQQDLGEGTFSAAVRARRKDTHKTVAGRAVAAALSAAGSVLEESEDRGHAAWGIVLSSLGAATRAATDATQAEHEELWVQRTSTP